MEKAKSKPRSKAAPGKPQKQSKPLESLWGCDKEAGPSEGEQRTAELDDPYAFVDSQSHEPETILRNTPLRKTPANSRRSTKTTPKSTARKSPALTAQEKLALREEEELQKALAESMRLNDIEERRRRWERRVDDQEGVLASKRVDDQEGVLASKRMDDQEGVLASKRMDDQEGVLTSKRMDDQEGVLASKRVDDQEGVLTSKRMDDQEGVLASKRMDDQEGVLASKRMDDQEGVLMKKVEDAVAVVSSAKDLTTSQIPPEEEVSDNAEECLQHLGDREDTTAVSSSPPVVGLQAVSASKITDTDIVNTDSRDSSMEEHNLSAEKPSPVKSRLRSLSLKRNRKKVTSHSVVFHNEPDTRSPNPKRVKLNISEHNTSKSDTEPNNITASTENNSSAIATTLCFEGTDSSKEPVKPDDKQQVEPASVAEETPDIGSDCEHIPPSTSACDISPKKLKLDEDFPDSSAWQSINSEVPMHVPFQSAKSTQTKSFQVESKESSPVILRRLDAYITGLHAAQCKVLQRISWGLPAKSHTKQPANTLDLIKKRTRLSARRTGKTLNPSCLLDLKTGRVVSADTMPHKPSPRSETTSKRSRNGGQQIKKSISPESDDIDMIYEPFSTPSRCLTRRPLSKPPYSSLMKVPRERNTYSSLMKVPRERNTPACSPLSKPPYSSLMKVPRERNTPACPLSEEDDTPPLYNETDHIVDTHLPNMTEKTTPHQEEKWLSRKGVRNISTIPNPATSKIPDDPQKQHPSEPDASYSGPAALLNAIDALEERVVDTTCGNKERRLLLSSDEETVDQYGTSSSVIDLTEDTPLQHHPSPPPQHNDLVACPMCQRKYPSSVIQEHASLCGGNSSGEDTIKKLPSAGQRRLGEFGRGVLSSYKDDNEIESDHSSSDLANSDADFIPPPQEGRDDGDNDDKAGGSQGAQYHRSEDGGYVVDLDTISDSPIKGFKKLSELPPQEREGYLNQFSRRARRGRKKATTENQQAGSSSWHQDGFDDLLNPGARSRYTGKAYHKRQGFRGKKKWTKKRK